LFDINENDDPIALGAATVAFVDYICCDNGSFIIYILFDT